MVKTAFFCENPATIDRVYAKGRKEMIGALSRVYPQVITKNNFDEHANELMDLEYIFSTWGMFTLTAQQLRKMPGLKAVFYAASSVKGFADCYLDVGVKVMSAWAANAVPVAEFALGQILLSNKGYFANIQHTKSLPGHGKLNIALYQGNFDQTVAILGAGMVGRTLIGLLKLFKLNVLVYDPYLSDEGAAELGIKKVTLEEAFKNADIVSNHMPDIPETAGILNASMFALMRDGATFINTGRGRSVVESELITELKKRPSLTALLDVTWPEPPEEGSEVYKMSNVFLSSHIAGSIGSEVVRMADYCIEEFKRHLNGERLKYDVTKEMLEKMA